MLHSVGGRLLIILGVFLLTSTTYAFNEDDIEEIQKVLDSKIMVIIAKYEDLSIKFDDLSSKYEDTISKYGSWETRQNELEDRVEKLEELAKVGTLRTCAEYAQYGLKTSGLYMVDPDGPLLGQPPFQVFCNFDAGTTEIMHDTENLTVVEHCHDPGCYEKSINYSYPDGEGRVPIPMSQIESLIQLSEYCEQDIQYDCTLAPLTVEGVDMAFWEDRTGQKNNYFTGGTYGEHVCDCHFEAGGCVEEETRHNTCNCDANLPAELSDTGTITNTSALPVVKLFFGGMTFDLQYGAFQLGRLKCYGEHQVDFGTSCSSLKKSGEFKSGYYNIKEYGGRVVYCDMTSETYDGVPQFDEVSFDALEAATAPVGTIISWTMKVDADETDIYPPYPWPFIPDGWQWCNGSVISEPSIWAGQRTPDLNTDGRFLRGGNEETLLTFEDDMMQDHQHLVDDPGHFHPYIDKTIDYGRSGHCYDYDCSNQVGDPTFDRTTTSNVTGISVNGISSGAGYRYGQETRPKNMRAIYIMRVY